jgi:STE24 endopeptidase
VLEAGVVAWPPELLDQVVAHELGHWRLGHTGRRMPITLAMQLATFALAAEVLSFQPLLRWAALPQIGDPRSYPLLLALTAVVALPARLILAAYDRSQERAADRFALTALADPDSYRAMLEQVVRAGGAPRRLPWWRRVVSSHPGIDDRIHACRPQLATATGRGM